MFPSTLSIHVLFVFLLQLLTVLAKVPLFSKCALHDSACLLRQAPIFVQAFSDGIPEKGIEKLDKMHFDKMHIEGDGFNFVTRNIAVEGFRNTTVNNISMDLTFKIIRLFFTTNFCTVSEYDMTGTLFTIPVFGKGTVTTIRKNIRLNVLIWFDIVKDDNGKSFVHFKTYNFGYDIKDGTYYNFSNAYDKIKGEQLNTFMNENWLIVNSNYGRKFMSLVMDKFYNVLKTCFEHNALEDIALY